jgi:uncharacterized protein (TIGR02271 family)
MLDQEIVMQARGQDLIDRDGDKIGRIEEIYVDQQTGRPEWALVNTGLFGTRSTFVPLVEAAAEEAALRVPYEQALVKDAPGIEAEGELSQDEEADLYRHYGLDYGEERSDSGLPEGETPERGAGDVPGSASDDAMTRSEEELRVGTSQREAGRARLRKYVVTDEVRQTVPVQREEVRVEREPITDANVEQATAGADISEEEHEVVLSEEEIVTEKRAVPKERVRLGKETVTEEHEVSEQVRKEQIEYEGEGDEGRSPRR